MTSEEKRKDRRRRDALSCLGAPTRELSANFLKPVAISNYSGQTKGTKKNVDLGCATGLVITRNNVCVSVCGVHVCVTKSVH